MFVAVAAPQRRRPPRRGGRANSDAERRALAKASGRRAGKPPPAPREAIGVAGANVAEYRALLAGLEHASRLGLGLVDARCDARLVVEHVSGVREPTNPRLRELCGAVREVAERIGTVAFTWVPAEANTRAHQLVAEALAAPS